MKKLLSLLFLITVNNISAQTKAEQFCFDNGLEVVSSKDETTTAKLVVIEKVLVLLALYDYTIEAVFVIDNKSIKLSYMRNTAVTNNGHPIDLTVYRGGFKETISKKSWKKIVNSVNNKVELIINNYAVD